MKHWVFLTETETNTYRGKYVGVGKRKVPIGDERYFAYSGPMYAVQYANTSFLAIGELTNPIPSYLGSEESDEFIVDRIVNAEPEMYAVTRYILKDVLHLWAAPASLRKWLELDESPPASLLKECSAVPVKTGTTAEDAKEAALVAIQARTPWEALRGAALFASWTKANEDAAYVEYNRIFLKKLGFSIPNEVDSLEDTIPITTSASKPRMKKLF